MLARRTDNSSVLGMLYNLTIFFLGFTADVKVLGITKALSAKQRHRAPPVEWKLEISLTDVASACHKRF